MPIEKELKMHGECLPRCLLKEKRCNLSVIEDTAKKLNCKPTEVFRRAAINLGFISYEQQSAIWVSRYVECRAIDKDVVDWCIDVMINRIPVNQIALRGGL